MSYQSPSLRNKTSDSAAFSTYDGSTTPPPSAPRDDGKAEVPLLPGFEGEL